MGEIQRFILLLLASAVVTVTARWIRLPYTLALLLPGLAHGFLNDTPILQLSRDVILLLFLPTPLFEAAFVLDLDLLWTRRRRVMVLALLGTVMALAAALSLPSVFPHQDESLAMTYGAVLFTLLVQGLTITPLVRLLGLQRTDLSATVT